MATLTGTFTCDNTTSTLYFKIQYRLIGETSWSFFNIGTSGTTYHFTGLDNRIYEANVTNVDGDTNAVSNTVQGIYITDPNPVISPTNSSVGYSFSNLSIDMDNYLCTIATFASPGVILATHTLPAGIFPGTVTDTFPGLNPLTQYVLSITPTANQFFRTFYYNFTTEALANCAPPQNTTAAVS